MKVVQAFYTVYRMFCSSDQVIGLLILSTTGPYWTTGPSCPTKGCDSLSKTNIGQACYLLSMEYRILGECLLISSLHGKALRTLDDIVRLAEI